MDKKEKQNIAFKKIKEVCLPIASNLQQNDFPSLNKSLLELQDLVKHEEQIEMIEILFEYLTFPLILILERDFSFRKNAKDQRYQVPLKTLETTVSTLTELFGKVEKIKTTKPDFTFQNLIIFQNLFVLYLKNEEKEKILFSNEELKFNIIELFNTFIVKHGKEDLECFRSFKTRSLIALFVGMLLEVSKEEISKDLKNLSLITLNNLFNLVENGEALLDFYPGTSSCLKNFITGDYKFGNQFICNSIITFGNITSKVCSDEFNERFLISNLPSIESLSLEIKGETKQIAIEDGSENFETLRKKIHSIFEIILAPKVYNELHPGSKFEIIKMSIELIKKCSKTLSKSIPLIVEVLMMGSYEESDLLSNLSKESLTQSSDILEFNDLFIDRFSFFIRNLTNIMSTIHEKEKFGYLNLINSYIEIFKEKIQPVLYSLIDEFSFSLLISLEIDSNVKIIERSSSFQKFTYENETKFPRKLYKNLNEQNENLIFRICENLGKFGDLSFLLDYFREILLDQKNLNYHSQCIMISSYLIKGGYQRNPMESVNQIDCLIDLYLSNEFSQDFDVKDLIKIYQHVMKTSSMLESISMFSTCLKDEFQLYLMRILYLLLEKLGDAYSFINQSSLICLCIISNNLKYKSIQNLIIENSDYIIDEICNRMKFLKFYPNTPFVVESLFEFTKNVDSKSEISSTLISLIEDISENVFVSLDNFHMTDSHFFYIESFFSILSNIIFILTNRLNQNQKERDLIKKIMKKSQHFLSISNISLRIKLLVIIKDCVEFYLKEDKRKDGTNESENIVGEIFPLIHSIWPSLMNIWSKEKKPQIQIYAIELIQNLMIHFDDFMYSRIVNDFYPKILKSLSENPLQFSNKKDFSFVKTTFEYKIKLKEIKFLNEAIKTKSIKSRLSLGKNFVNSFEICKVLDSYLDESQPNELQVEVLNIFENLIKEDADSVWFFIHSFLGSEFQSTSEHLKTIQFQKNGKFNLIQNVKRIELMLNKN
jgi:hypothetical protein